MKQADIIVGRTYIVKVSGALVPVRLEQVSAYGGWEGRNLRTNRVIRIRTAAKLRREYVPAPICRCLHRESQHTTHASGARPCTYFGCGCSNFDRAAA